MRKRKTPSNGRVVKRRRTTRSSPTAGYTRVSGYYGRYAPVNPLSRELKFFDTTKVATTAAAAGTIHNSSLCLVPQGVTESTRVGRKLTIKSIHVRLVCNLANSSSQPDDGVRVILFLDTQCNGASATVGDILESANYLSWNNLANKNRFRTLHDEFIDITSTAGAYTGAAANFASKAYTKEIHKNVNIPVQFDSTTGAITEIKSNNIGLLTISDQGGITVRSYVRIRFSDM